MFILEGCFKTSPHNGCTLGLLGIFEKPHIGLTTEILLYLVGSTTRPDTKTLSLSHDSTMQNSLKVLSQNIPSFEYFNMYIIRIE